MRAWLVGIQYHEGGDGYERVVVATSIEGLVRATGKLDLWSVSIIRELPGGIIFEEMT